MTIDDDNTQDGQLNAAWLEHYPDDVPSEIDADQYTSLIDFFEQAVSRYGDKVAFANMGQEITFNQLDNQSRAFAAWLQRGIYLKKGDRVALMLPNVLQHPVVLFGILRAGMVAVNINPLYTPSELEHQLKDSGAIAIVVLSSVAYKLEKVIAGMQIRYVMITGIGDLFSMPKRLLVNFVVKYVKRLVPEYHLPATVSLRGALRQGAKMLYQRPDIINSDLAFLQYTGGTTGTAKGAMLTHRNMQANVIQIKAAYGRLLREGCETFITALPLYHIFALTTNCLLPVELGGRNILITNPRDVDGMVREMAKYPFTVLTGVNTLFNVLLNDPNFCRLNFKSLRVTAAGGMAVARSVAERWEKLTGCFVLEGYGLTECSPLVSANPHNTMHYTGSIGLPVPSTDIRVVDNMGNDVPAGHPGELCIRGPQVMQGYWNQQAETNNVLKNGWLHSGDIVTVDNRGFLHIVDRKKDMVLVSGFNVYPSEIEEVLMQHPKVYEAAAIGLPHEIAGETLKVYVVKSDSSLSEREIRIHCKRFLASYKVPKLIEFRQKLPKSNVGKILRRELREEAIREIKPDV